MLLLINAHKKAGNDDAAHEQRPQRRGLFQHDVGEDLEYLDVVSDSHGRKDRQRREREGDNAGDDAINKGWHSFSLRETSHTTLKMVVDERPTL